MVRGLFKGGVYFVQLEPDDGCGKNSRKYDNYYELLHLNLLLKLDNNNSYLCTWQCPAPSFQYIQWLRTQLIAAKMWILDHAEMKLQYNIIWQTHDYYEGMLHFCYESLGTAPAIIIIEYNNNIIVAWTWVTWLTLQFPN